MNCTAWNSVWANAETRIATEREVRQREIDRHKAIEAAEINSREEIERARILQERAISGARIANEKETEALEIERQDWVDQCGNRRYREDDEKAIRAGR